MYLKFLDIIALKAQEQRYIQDGLVFQLDGINTGSQDSNKWVDLIGGISFTLGENVRRLAKGFYFPAGSSAANTGVASGIFYPAYVPQLFTTEIVVRQDTPGYIFTGSSTGLPLEVNISTYDNVITRAVQSAPVYRISASNKYISANSSFCVIDGEEKSRSYNDYYSIFNGQRIIISASYNNDARAYRGDIYAIRMYNRVLTVAEMQKNQRIDRLRFGI